MTAIARALDAFQALLKSTYTGNPTANRDLIAAARAELAQLRAMQEDTHREVSADRAALPADR
jgi:hypothetical protein